MRFYASIPRMHSPVAELPMRNEICLGVGCQWSFDNSIKIRRTKSNRFAVWIFFFPLSSTPFCFPSVCLSLPPFLSLSSRLPTSNLDCRGQGLVDWAKANRGGKARRNDRWASRGGAAGNIAEFPGAWSFFDPFYYGRSLGLRQNKKEIHEFYSNVSCPVAGCDVDSSRAKWERLGGKGIAPLSF